MSVVQDKKSCAVFIQEPISKSLLPTFIAHLRLLIKLQFQIELTKEFTNLPENFKSHIRIFEPPKKKASLLSKLFKPLIGGEAEAPVLNHNSFSMSYDLEGSEHWCSQHILITNDLFSPTATSATILKKAKKIIVGSQIVKKHLVEHFQIPPQTIEVIYPFYNRELYSNKDKVHLRNLSRQKMGLESKNFIVGYLDEATPPPEEKDFLENLALKLAENANIKMLAYSSAQVPLPTFYHGLDLFIKPATSYKFGLAGLEAMACGLPVLTHFGAGVSELILSKQFVKENLDVQSWSTFIFELEAQRDWLASIGRQNSERALMFDENQHLKRFIQMLSNDNFVAVD